MTKYLRRGVALLAPLLLALPIMAAGCDPEPAVCQTHAKLTASTTDITKVVQWLYNVGFHDDADLLAGTSIGIAESSLWIDGRNWHQEYGYRPSSDTVCVKSVRTGDGGSPTQPVWNGTQGMHADRGLWQISSRSWPQYDDPHVDTPADAAVVVKAIKDQTGTWNTWDTYASGAAQLHYDQARDGWPAIRPIVTSFCSSHDCT